MLRRQCTREYKIEPIERFIKTELLGLEVRSRWPTEPVINQWFGISSDEASRMKTSPVKWRTNIYPLCGVPTDMLPRPMSRQGCIEWLRENTPDRHIPKSACIGCPFKDNRAWRYLRDRYPDEWADAVNVDRTIRHADKKDGQAFLHRDCVPLDEADIDLDPDQGDFGWDEECTGYCGS